MHTQYKLSAYAAGMLLNGARRLKFGKPINGVSELSLINPSQTVLALLAGTKYVEEVKAAPAKAEKTNEKP